MACQRGHIEVARLLLDHGADIKAQNAVGEMVLALQLVSLCVRRVGIVIDTVI